MQRGKKIAAVAAAGTCVLAGAAAGISQSAASSSSGSSSLQSGKAGTHARLAGAPGFGHGGRGGEIHAVEVVPNKAGTGFVTETEDNGTITAVDTGAGKITLKEGTSSATYATPAITIPSGATVLLDGAASSLEKLKTGDHVSISSSSEGTTVFATDSSFQPGAGHAPGGMGGPRQGGAPQVGMPPAQGY